MVLQCSPFGLNALYARPFAIDQSSLFFVQRQVLVHTLPALTAVAPSSRRIHSVTSCSEIADPFLRNVIRGHSRPGHRYVTTYILDNSLTINI